MAARETVDGEEVWSIREVYDGTGWTARDAAPSASTHDELREVLRMMMFDIEHRDYLDLDAGVVAHRSGGLRTLRPDKQWGDASAWADRQGDVWHQRDDGQLETFETAPFSREHVEKKWGPLIRLSKRHEAGRDLDGRTWDEHPAATDKGVES